MAARPSLGTRGWCTSLRDEGTAGITLGRRDGAMALWDGTVPLPRGRRDRSPGSRSCRAGAAVATAAAAPAACSSGSRSEPISLGRGSLGRRDCCCHLGTALSSLGWMDGARDAVAGQHGGRRRCSCRTWRGTPVDASVRAVLVGRGGGRWCHRQTERGTLENASNRVVIVGGASVEGPRSRG